VEIEQNNKIDAPFIMYEYVAQALNQEDIWLAFLYHLCLPATLFQRQPAVLYALYNTKLPVRI
jgi:hypothetical protein